MASEMRGSEEGSAALAVAVSAGGSSGNRGGGGLWKEGGDSLSWTPTRRCDIVGCGAPTRALISTTKADVLLLKKQPTC